MRGYFNVGIYTIYNKVFQYSFRIKVATFQTKQLRIFKKQTVHLLIQIWHFFEHDGFETK